MKTTTDSRKWIRDMRYAIQTDPEDVGSLLADIDELLNANARLAPKAKAHDEMLRICAADTLDRVLEFLEKHHDVVDGEYGPVPNCAMSLTMEVERLRHVIDWQEAKEPAS